MATYSNTNKKDVYEAITEQLIQKIEQGVCPWLSPYLATVGFPKNFATKNSYRGINVFLLGMAGFSSPWFLTFVQAKALGGNVKKGEKGSFVVKYGTYETENESGEEQNIVRLTMWFVCPTWRICAHRNHFTEPFFTK